MSMRSTAIVSAAMMAFAVPGILAAEAAPAPAAAAAPALTVTYYYIPG